MSDSDFYDEFGYESLTEKLVAQKAKKNESWANRVVATGRAIAAMCTFKRG